MYSVPFADLVAWFPAAFRAFAQAAAPVAVAGLWQGAAVALGLAVCLHIAPRVSAAHRFWAWAAGFLVAAGLGFMPVLAHFLAAANGSGGSGIGGTAKPWLERPIFEIDARWTLAIAALWVALAAFRAVDLAVHSLRLRQLWKSARPVNDELVDELVGSFAATGARGRSVEICTTRALNQPSVIGFFWPRILIPEWLYARLTRAELEQVVLHECEHLRRRDDWTNLLQKLCLVLFPLNPALAWMEQRLRREREMACDEGVVRVTRAPRAYAACLASLAERGLERGREQSLEQGLARRAAASLSLGAFERRSELVGRVHSILRRKNVLSPWGSRALVGAVGCGLLVASVELARSPQVVEFVSPLSVARASLEQGPSMSMQTARLAGTPDVAEAGVAAHPTDLVARNAAAYRATNTVAILPAAPVRQAMHRDEQTNLVASAQAGRKANPMRVASGEPRQKLVETEAASFAAQGSVAQGPAANEMGAPRQWIVLTTWEQVDAPAPGSGEVADYDTGTDPSAASQDAARQDAATPTPDAARPAQPTWTAPRRTTITQLILRVYPADSNCARGERTQTGARANSESKSSDFKSVLNRPSILPLDGGWLFFQL
jgi:beta-lactamase regulating signal transducer with metallopeptidase domain